MNNVEPTNADILEAIQDFAASVDQRFDCVDRRFGRVESDVAGIKSDMATVKSQMVTKDYLDEKLADQFSDIVNHVKRMAPSWAKSGA